MNPMGLMEMAQVKEQESMREALRRAAIREARKQAGITWFQAVRARLFRQRDAVAAAPAAAPARAAALTPAAPAPVPAAPTTNGTPVLVHHIRIRQHASPASSSVAPAESPAPKLRVVQAAELDCVGADC
ncbi:MAG: hypothetical protein JOZ75_11610 [Candidatus Dormibacteraeota bacterium]|nr:hypothetical protein [Candidatus Dormibacteraeota bacterium]